MCFICDEDLVHRESNQIIHDSLRYVFRKYSTLATRPFEDYNSFYCPISYYPELLKNVIQSLLNYIRVEISGLSAWVLLLLTGSVSYMTRGEHQRHDSVQ